jgi:hypothetical protein
MPTEVDALSDKALAASKLAHTTHSDDAHKSAKVAHEAAYMAARAADRPSLAASHLQQAAEHDRACDATTCEGKGAAAHRATLKARASGKAQDHKDAAQAHKDASSAASESGNGRLSMRHSELSYQHDDTARRIENPPQPLRPVYG